MPNVKLQGCSTFCSAPTRTSHRSSTMRSRQPDSHRPRRHDIRANHVGGDFITLTWRDVTERVHAAERIAQTESRFLAVSPKRRRCGDACGRRNRLLAAPVERRPGARRSTGSARKFINPGGAHVRSCGTLLDRRAGPFRADASRPPTEPSTGSRMPRRSTTPDGRPDGYTLIPRHRRRNACDGKRREMPGFKQAKRRRALPPSGWTAHPSQMCVADAKADLRWSTMR